MDYDNGKAHQQWEWQREESGLQKQSNYDGSASLWCSEVPQNEEDISYMFDDEATTPVKACGDLALHVGQNEWTKDSLECNESFSQMKRRRMLQFNNDDDDMDSSLFCEELSPAFLKSNEGVDSIDEALTADWAPSFEENSSASMYEEALDQSAEWIRDCFIDTEMHYSPETANSPGVSASELRTEITEFCKISPAVNSAPRRPVSTSRKIIIKGKKSFIRAPSKLPSSVAYPFAFIKPSGAHGDVTLKDINQKIRTPPPQKSKQKEEGPVIVYPTSAFSGKPVVGKTKIRTEGGKGSITIMRTKG